MSEQSYFSVDSAKYVKNSSGEVTGIEMKQQNTVWIVPIDDKNTFYKEMMLKVNNGELVIEEVL